MLISRPKLLCISANLVGFDSRLEEMSSLLCMESNDVRMIGIHGIGGIGKTTLAIGIYNQIAHQFEGASFLPNAAEHRGSLIQRKLLADILGEKIARISNIDEGISLIKKTLCSRKVLIILDDVSALTQLEFLAGSRHWFGSGSRIIITSRNKHLLDVHEVDGLYEVQKLKSEEAFKLFSLYAFEGPPDDRFWELSGRALNYCDGLPLAVKVVGCYLRKKTELEWEDELLKLTTVGQITVQYVLRLSYDRLEHTEKDLFLDIACFFRGRTQILQQDRNAWFDATNGLEIIRRESPGQPGQRSRLWNPEDVHAVLTQKTGTKAIEGISFDVSASKEIQITSEALKKMTNLRLLRVYWDGLSSYDSNTVHLPEEFEFPSYELRYLHWDGWSLESLPSNFNGKKLVELSLKHSSLNHLWKGNKCLENLKVMDLSHSPYLVECPDVSGAPSLETLNLNGCTSLHEVHPSIPRLKNLKILNLGNCRMLYYFPRIIGLEKLEVLNLSGCSRLEKFPDIEANMESLLELYLEGTAIIELPSSVGYLRGLVLLNMKSCKNLKILPGRICDLKSLKTLILSGCSKLERIPEITEVMEHLEELLLDGTSIRELPCSILHLKGLVLLNLRKCKDLRSLPNRICGLKSLETLIVSGCSKTQQIARGPGNVAMLKELLHRENSDDIGLQLPSLSGLRFMENLDLSDCNLMEGTIDNKLCHLELLEVLNLSRNYMVSIPADISRLSNLKVLLVRQSLRSLPTPSRMISLQHRLVSTWLRPVEFMLWNCSGLYQDHVAMALETLHRELFPEIGYSIVIPGRGIPKWRWHENMGASVSATLPPHWLDNNFLGVALCAVLHLRRAKLFSGLVRFAVILNAGKGLISVIPSLGHTVETELLRRITCV
ncbi:Disease resistance-like protein DSC1 [Vitis vinifera]|uniref:ADP-ribosyl cyclase/cyclic ADP-ribose hydrolase n=1 Tax=Vitis vinifera TaxID=29760 RepID=A0A438BM91_VITVI|nr:Disease resistance-like protein DSC1 [Vitis vinifera]